MKDAEVRNAAPSSVANAAAFSAALGCSRLGFLDCVVVLSFFRGIPMVVPDALQLIPVVCLQVFALYNWY